MRAIAEVPGSTCELYSVRNLTKRYCQQQKEKKRNKQVAASAANWFILSIEGEKEQNRQGETSAVSDSARIYPAHQQGERGGHVPWDC